MVSVFTIMHTVKVCGSQHKTCNWAKHSSGKFYVHRQLVCSVPITMMLLNPFTGRVPQSLTCSRLANIQPYSKVCGPWSPKLFQYYN